MARPAKRDQSSRAVMHQDLPRIEFAADLALMAVAAPQNLFALSAELLTRETRPAIATPAASGSEQIGSATATEQGLLHETSVTEKTAPRGG
jgi:hypothetical protein